MPPVSRACSLATLGVLRKEPARLVMLLCKIQNENCWNYRQPRRKFRTLSIPAQFAGSRAYGRILRVFLVFSQGVLGNLS
jgi:hypothetical protein